MSEANKLFLGIDVGSMATKIVAIDINEQLIAHECLGTHGKPIPAALQGLAKIYEHIKKGTEIVAVGVTGSAREIISKRIGADLVKNEITAHATASLYFHQNVRTIIEIGGQDSKIILMKDSVVSDFNMNTICAAGTGSFLDHQAQRLGLSNEQFGDFACHSHAPEKLSGRCTIFAESEMIHRQQCGAKQEDIVYGLCQLLVSNYLDSVAIGKAITPPVVFQGGVALNRGIVRALEEALKTRLLIPMYPQIFGALGAALLAKRNVQLGSSLFVGFDSLVGLLKNSE